MVWVVFLSVAAVCRPFDILTCFLAFAHRLGDGTKEILSSFAIPKLPALHVGQLSWGNDLPIASTMKAITPAPPPHPRVTFIP